MVGALFRSTGWSPHRFAGESAGIVHRQSAELCEGPRLPSD